MSARKTVNLKDLKARVNRMIAATAPEMKGEREALCTLIENVMFDAKDYRGYGYLQLMSDADPYVKTGDIAAFQKSEAFDSTRRFYY